MKSEGKRRGMSEAGSPPKRSRTLSETFFIWFHYKWRHLPQEAREFLFSLVGALAAIFGLLALLFGISFAVSRNIVELPVVASFGLVELFAFFLARYFLREGRDRRTVMELMAVLDDLPKYSHLIVHFVNHGFKEDYPNKPMYVLNTAANWAFWVPSYVDELAKIGAIQRVEHDTEKEMNLWL